MLMASIAFVMPEPRMAVTATARSTPGKAKMTSSVRMMTALTGPRNQPAMRPMISPKKELNAIGTAATGSETRPPQISRLRMSRPWPSVPSR